jgi:signal peptide peptidase SppA
MLPHLASRLLGTPLLVHRAKLDVILAVLGDRLNIQPPAADLALPGPRTMPSGTPGIAVIPVQGTLVKRTAGLDAASGLTSYTEIAALLNFALADPQVAGILLDIDSPGGEASGSFELARQVREASAVKPVWAVANDVAYSAAYAIGSAANRLIVSETGGVGSIGVIALHIDQSVKDANDGYRFTAITAGAHKNDFSPHQPLTDDAKSELQAEVDRLYGLFVDHVASMRSLASRDVRSTEAGLFFGANAIAAGLADSVGTFESAVADFSLYLNSRSRTSPQARAVTRTGAATPTKEHVMETREETQEAVLEMIGVDAAATQLAALVAEAKREVTQSAQAIAEMCLIAGAPEKAAEFIAAGKSEADVRRVLIEGRAARSEATTIQSTLNTGTQEAFRPETSPIVSAVKKLIARE